MTQRYDRNELLFGAEGQKRIARQRVGVVGGGGLGCFVELELAYLGVGAISAIDRDIVTDSSLNRLIPAGPSDLGRAKVDVIQELVRHARPEIELMNVKDSVLSDAGLHALRACTAVLACVDLDGVRAVVNEICLAYEIPLFDLASDIDPKAETWGGHVVSVIDGTRCVFCALELDGRDVERDLQNDAERRDRDRAYGVDRGALEDRGPSVVSINATVASLGVTEFMCFVTGLRAPKPMLNYRGHEGSVTRPSVGSPDCYFCRSVRGRRDGADVQRYWRR